MPINEKINKDEESKKLYILYLEKCRKLETVSQYLRVIQHAEMSPEAIAKANNAMLEANKARADAHTKLIKHLGCQKDQMPNLNTQCLCPRGQCLRFLLANVIEDLLCKVK